MIAYSGPELYERVLVRKITNGQGIAEGSIPVEVDGIFMNATLGDDGVVHLDLEQLNSTVEQAKAAIEEQNSGTKSGAPEKDDTKPPLKAVGSNRAARRAPAEKAAPRKR